MACTNRITAERIDELDVLADVLVDHADAEIPLSPAQVRVVADAVRETVDEIVHRGDRVMGANERVDQLERFLGRAYRLVVALKRDDPARPRLEKMLLAALDGREESSDTEVDVLRLEAAHG